MRCWFQSASPTFSQYVDATVSSVSDTSITLVSMPTFALGHAVAAGDLVVQDTWDDADGTTGNAAQGLAQRGYVFGADDTLTLNSSAPYTYG